MRLALCRALAGCFAVLSVAALSACGGTNNDGSVGGTAGGLSEPQGKFVDIYSSLPVHGPSAGEATALANGIRLALAQANGKAGEFTVQYSALDDSAGPSGWDASKTAANARKAAADPRAVYYIGEFDDDASEVSMPILNQAGIAQISPANTYVGLTTNQPGSITGEPGRYAPSGTRTYLRIVPIDSVQAAADLLAMSDAGCTKVAIASDGEAYGAGLARLIQAQKAYYGIDVVSLGTVRAGAHNYRDYAARLKGAHADCFMLAAVASGSDVLVTKDVHLALPRAKIFGPQGMCVPAWTNPKDGGVPATVDPLIECTQVTESVTAYPGGKAFAAAYKARYPGSNPTPYTILGYEAMKLALSTIAGLGDKGDTKSAVLGALFATAGRHSALGTYGFDKDGDTTLRSIGLYKVGRNGNPTFVKALTPARVL
ncbi:MAG TPA: branched-chain amino acid ABC transporter substrate-binding protein [Solirubrobacteraceae bacterium]|nr:branched-chain amino acid ABC transporter substrate-binding protein [Solirubrobacteraceae bacterium]